ncbi:hypothetical protein ACOSQ4_029070 [Xanthoceras sorbifolium]
MKLSGRLAKDKTRVGRSSAIELPGIEPEEGECWPSGVKLRRDLSINERFVFTSPPALERMTAVDAGHHNPCKRARSFCDEPLTKLGDCDRCGGDKGCCCRADGDRGGCNRGGEGRGSNDSFKYKVMNLSSWQGIRVRKDRLKIEDDDIVLTEGLYGPDVILSDELKKKLRALEWLLEKSRNSKIAEENNSLNRPATTGGVKARGTRVAPEKFRNNKVAEKNNSLNRAAVKKGSRFAVLANSVEEDSVPHVDHKSKGKSPMVTTGDDDVTLAKGPRIFRDISNMGHPHAKRLRVSSLGHSNHCRKLLRLRRLLMLSKG